MSPPRKLLLFDIHQGLGSVGTVARLEFSGSAADPSAGAQLRPSVENNEAHHNFVPYSNRGARQTFSPLSGSKSIGLENA